MTPSFSIVRELLARARFQSIRRMVSSAVIASSESCSISVSLGVIAAVLGVSAMLERPARDRRPRKSMAGNLRAIGEPTFGRANSSATARQRRYRRRLRTGAMPVTVDIDAPIVAMLVETRWLREADSADKAAIGRAIERMLADAAQR
jgi:hypothetical protein